MADQAIDLKLGKKRRVPRRIFRQRVGVLFKGVYHYGQSHQLGEGGLLLETDEQLNENDRILVNFYLPIHGLLVIRGIVRYRMKELNAVSGFAYGVQFEHIDFELKRQIRNFVASQKTSVVQDFNDHEPSIKKGS